MPREKPVAPRDAYIAATQHAVTLYTKLFAAELDTDVVASLRARVSLAATPEETAHVEALLHAAQQLAARWGVDTAAVAHATIEIFDRVALTVGAEDEDEDEPRPVLADPADANRGLTAMAYAHDIAARAYGLSTVPAAAVFDAFDCLTT